MFKHIKICLDGPICKCKAQDLAWSIKLLDDFSHTLVIRCRTCDQRLQVARKNFVAVFVLDTPYAEVASEPKSEPVVVGVPKAVSILDSETFQS